MTEPQPSRSLLRARRGVADPVPPHLWFLVSSVFRYLGPAFTVLLFARMDALGVARLRILTAAVVLIAWRRPWRHWPRLPKSVRRLVLAWGLVLAGMNSVFYLAIERLPLGTVAAIEFLPVIALAALPVGIGDARPALTDLSLLAGAVGVGVGVSSSVIPYVCDQLAMRRLTRGAYALMTSLLPAAATVIGVVVLAQVPSVLEILGVALVVLGVALHRSRVTPPPQESPATPGARRS